MSPRLTVLLPLKGRPLFTLRFLWHANRQKMPYRFVIADGEVHPELACLLENSSALFPNLDIEYVRYPDDRTFSNFFEKMADALGRVRTPYVVIADNDDFLIASGIERTLDFLDAHKDYVCCGSGIAGFSVYAGLNDPNGNLLGKTNRWEYRYTSYDASRDFSSDSAAERLRQGTRYWWSYYAVYRAEALAKIWREIREINFSDLQIHELFCTMRPLTMGKVRSDPTAFSYCRQYGTSLQASYKKDWVHHLLRSRFTSDFNETIERISRYAAEADGVDRAQIDEDLRLICDDWLREFLRVYYGPLQSLKQYLRDNAPGLVHWLKNRRRYVVFWERQSLFRKLAASGAAPEYRDVFRRELTAIEDVFNGADFARFVSPHIPKLSDGRSGRVTGRGAA